MNHLGKNEVLNLITSYKCTWDGKAILHKLNQPPVSSSFLGCERPITSRQPIAVSDISIYICLIDIRSKSKEQLNERRAGLSTYGCYEIYDTNLYLCKGIRYVAHTRKVADRCVAYPARKDVWHTMLGKGAIRSPVTGPDRR